LKAKSNAPPDALVLGLLRVWQVHLPGLRKGVFPDYQFAAVLKQLLVKL
jgi:hypothetical protein